MTEQEKLYETLGELLYVVAKADGVIQEEEKQAMQNLLQSHPWAEQINWSFDYEVSKGKSVEEIYHKVISFCKHYGPAPQYNEFIEAINIVAEAVNGRDESEEKIIKSFSADLIKKFQRDIDLLNER